MPRPRKLTVLTCEQIKEEYQKTQKNYTTLSLKYGVSQSVISAVINGKYKARNLNSRISQTYDNQYELKTAFDDVWLKVGNINLHIIRTDEGVVVYNYPYGKEAEQP